MRALLAIGMIFGLFNATAMSPEYDSYVNYIERQNLNDRTSAAQRLFISYSAAKTNGTIILRFHKGISLRDIIDATPLKGSLATVYVLRPDQKTKPVFEGTVRAHAKPDFEVLPLDLLFLSASSVMPSW